MHLLALLPRNIFALGTRHLSKDDIQVKENHFLFNKIASIFNKICLL
jgi:hypothetical protein